jgi:pilus assembly protein CpaE
MSENKTELLSDAQRALERGDRQLASSLLDRVLQQDFLNAIAWDLLHEEFGPRMTLNRFRKKFTEKYYPDKLSLLEATGPVFEDVDDEFDESVRQSDRFGRSRRVQTEPLTADGSKPRKGLLGWLRGLFGGVSTNSKKQTPKKAKRTSLENSRFNQAAGRSESVESSPVIASLSGAADPFEDDDLDEPENAPLSSAVPKVKSSTPPTHGNNSAAAPTSRPEPSAAFPDVVPPMMDEGDQIKVLIVDDIPQTRDNLRRLLLLENKIEVVGTASSGAEAILQVAQKQPHVVLMDINMPDMDGIEATTEVRTRNPIVQVVMLTVQDDPVYMRAAIRAGARDFLIKPPTLDELIGAIFRSYEIWQEEKIRLEPKPQADQPSLAYLQETFQSRIITIYSPKGGTGSTTLAANLAVALQRDDSQVLIIDANMHFGTVEVAFNERAERTLLDLAPRVADLDPQVVEDVLVTHDRSQVKLLRGPQTPVDADALNSDDFIELLDYLRGLYPYIIIDAGTEIDDATLAVFDASDQVVVVGTQEIPTLFRVRQFFDLAPSVGLPTEKITFVLNRFNPKINISEEQISKNFNVGVQAIIPSDYQAAVTSFNSGVPILMEPKLRGRPIALAIKKLAGELRKKLFATEPV